LIFNNLWTAERWEQKHQPRHRYTHMPHTQRYGYTQIYNRERWSWGGLQVHRAPLYEQTVWHRRMKGLWQKEGLRWEQTLQVSFASFCRKRDRDTNKAGQPAHRHRYRYTDTDTDRPTLTV